MVARAYVPDRGDVVWVTFDPQAGHEQKGRRPALVVSSKSYNKKSGLVLVCPLTSQAKGYPFEVQIDVLKDPGVVLADQIKSIDWRARKVKKMTIASPETMSRVLQFITVLINGN